LERPFFDDISPRNVSAVVDEIAILRCRVKNKGNRTVSHYGFFLLFLHIGLYRNIFIRLKSTFGHMVKSTTVRISDGKLFEGEVTLNFKLNLGTHQENVLFFKGSFLPRIASLRCLFASPFQLSSQIYVGTCLHFHRSSLFRGLFSI